MRVVLVLAGCFCAAPALAQEPEPGSESDERAKALNDEGSRLYEQGLYEEAVAAFKIAYSLSRRPLLLYNMAQAMERLGQWDEALAALEDYRLDAYDDELPTLDSRIDALKKRIAEREAAEAAAEPPPAPVVAERRGPPPAAWALWATGAVGVGVGSVFTGRALGARSEWTAQCVDGGDGLLCPSVSAEDVKRDNAASVVADVGWIVGVGASGAGVAVALGGRW